jgi:hypothetical protein
MQSVEYGVLVDGKFTGPYNYTIAYEDTFQRCRRGQDAEMTYRIITYGPWKIMENSKPIRLGPGDEGSS